MSKRLKWTQKRHDSYVTWLCALIAFARSIFSRRVYDLRIITHAHRQASYGELQLLRSKLVSNLGALITPIHKSQSSLSFRLQPPTENIANLRIPWSIQRYIRIAQPVLDSSHTWMYSFNCHSEKYAVWCDCLIHQWLSINLFLDSGKCSVFTLAQFECFIDYNIAKSPCIFH